MIRHLGILVAIVMTAALAGCGGSSHRAEAVIGDTLTTEAGLLTLVDCGDFIAADIRDPWAPDRMLARYALVDSAHSDVALPQGYQRIVVPVTSSVVYSSVHAGAITELGCTAAITGVADASYYKLPAIVAGLRDGSVTDIGSSMNPASERIVTLEPNIILASPFQNAGHGVIERLGVPIVECADYMEATPLGRAEWIKLLGVLYGNYNAADSIFSASSAAYRDLAAKASRASRKPSVITEQVTDGVWYLPGGKSYMARIIADAGASYPWASDTSSGSLQLDAATVLDRARDADYWIIRTYGTPLTLDALSRNNPLNREFRAFAHGGVYSCDTSQAPLFEEFPFHPELLLREYMTIFHPELFPEGSALKYFHQVQ